MGERLERMETGAEGPVVPIDQREILRYLGYGREQPDEQILALVESTIAEVKRTARPRHITGECKLELMPDGEIAIGSIHVVSRSLSRT